mmetsp:Transcript_106501/g.323326  ORF Transcript_106501/g.323326 Transcript_106501/m.323326 type:complete len:250 (+) Transcript_106501:122-871(+)
MAPPALCEDLSSCVHRVAPMYAPNQTVQPVCKKLSGSGQETACLSAGTCRRDQGLTEDKANMKFNLTAEHFHRKACVPVEAETLGIQSRRLIRPPLVRFFARKSCRSISLYSSKDPSKTVTVPGMSFEGPGMTTHSSSATIDTNLSSWLTSTTPPSNLFNAIARPSIVSRSKWFVGSSKSKRWGDDQASSAKASRLFCPPLRCFTGCNAKSPWRPNRPRYFRASSTVTSLVPSSLMPPTPRRLMCTTES